MIQESLDEEIWGSQTEREVISNNMGITELIRSLFWIISRSRGPVNLKLDSAA